ncbi:MAG: hypothetical protein ETSY1_46305 (plasmid) [Candidatus Entotheonella factor]|uniref:ABC transporter domain-containing protein n=1 Tax=Entotheonella factor TaxID=1429438 RepID=W4M0N2_ENTF1|nr:MAG: hypothetical protein ETSY1_46305 [Candidatus Entotheonella factor]
MMTTSIDHNPNTQAFSPCAHLLRHWGHRVTARELAEQCGYRAIPGAVAAELKRRGLDVRVVRIQTTDFRFLSLPTLLFWRSGQTAMVLRATRRHLTLAMADERVVRLPIREVKPLAHPVSFDIGSHPPSSHTWLAVMVQELWQRPKHMLHLVLLSLLLAGVGLVLPAVTALVMDQALPTRDLSLLHTAVAGCLVLTLYRSVLGLLRDGVQRVLESQLEGRGLRHLLAHLLTMPYRRASQETVGSAMQGLTSVTKLTHLATTDTLLPLIDLLTSIIYGIGLAILLPPAAAIMAAIGGMAVTLVAALAQGAAAQQEREITMGSRHQGLLYEIISGLDALRAASATDGPIQRWAEDLLEHRQAALSRERLAIWARIVVMGSTQIVRLGIFAWGGLACLDGRLTVGELLAAFMLTDGAMSALSRLSLALFPLLTARVHLARLKGLQSPSPGLSLGPSGITSKHPQPSRPIVEANRIVVDNVWFRCSPDDPWIVAGESFEAHMGEVVHLRGPSGQGKTTLLRLIAGLLEPEQGAIWVLGRPAAAGRSDILYIPQDVQLFEGTLFGNLSLLSGAAHDAILEAAEATGLADWIARLPMGFNTILPPGGSTLSSGQRQLVILTAAVAARRRVLLLDEALCHLDRLAQQRLLSQTLFPDAIVISVSHNGLGPEAEL